MSTKEDFDAFMAEAAPRLTQINADRHAWAWAGWVGSRHSMNSKPPAERRCGTCVYWDQYIPEGGEAPNVIFGTCNAPLPASIAGGTDNMHDVDGATCPVWRDR